MSRFLRGGMHAPGRRHRTSGWLKVEPFAIHIGDQVLEDLRARIRATRWPEAAPGELWKQGTERGYLRELLGYWADGFDWRSRERELNAMAQFRADSRRRESAFRA